MGWSAGEDTRLVALVAEMASSEEGSVRNWAEVADRITGRTTKQCRERWFNHLDPSIKRGNYTAEEDKLIMEQQAMIGNRWSVISGMLPGRTEDAVKIRWKTLTRPASSANRSAKKRKPKTNSTNSSVSSKAQKENRKPLLRKKMPEQKEVDRFVRKGCSKNLSELFAASEIPSAMVDFEGEIFSDHLNKQPSLSELCLLDFDLPLQRIRRLRHQSPQWSPHCLSVQMTILSVQMSRAPTKTKSITVTECFCAKFYAVRSEGQGWVGLTKACLSIIY